MLFGGISADEQDGRRLGNVLQPCGLALGPRKCAGKVRVVGRALVIDVVGAEHSPCKLLQQIVFFVGRPVGADDADGRAALAVANLFELAGCKTQRMLPGGRLKLALCIAHQRSGQPFGTLHKIKTKAPLGAQEVAIHAALVAIVRAHDLVPSFDWRTPSVTLQPSAQCVQTVDTWFISQGRVL